MLSWLTRPHTESTWIIQQLRTIFQFVEFVAILIAISAFFMELQDRQEERTAQAWQLLATKAPGNSGMIKALEYLNNEGSWPLKRVRVSLEGIDLTPPAIPQEWEFGQEGAFKPKRIIPKKCPQFTYLQSVELVNAKLNGAVLVCCDLYKASFQEASLRGADLRNARLLEADLRKADLQGADLRGADLGSVTYGRPSTGAQLKETDLKGADLRGVKMIGCIQLQQAKNWADAYRDKELGCGEEIPLLRQPPTLPPSAIGPSKGSVAEKGETTL